MYLNFSLFHLYVIHLWKFYWSNIGWLTLKLDTAEKLAHSLQTRLLINPQKLKKHFDLIFEIFTNVFLCTLCVDRIKIGALSFFNLNARFDFHTGPDWP